MRNDQRLARRQRARTLVAVSGEDRGRRHVIALRQHIQRVAGADDDRRAALRTRGSDRARRHAAGGLQLRLGRRRVGRDARARLRTRPGSRPGRICGAATAGGGRRRGLRCGREYCGSSRRSTCPVSGRGPLCGTEPVARPGNRRDWRWSFAEARRMSALQPATPNEISASAAICGARREPRTRQHQTWLLTRTQQTYDFE